MDPVVRINAAWPDGFADMGMLEQLNADIGRIGTIVAAEGGPAPAGSKGVPLHDLATIAVALLATPAVVAFVNVLKSYVERDRSLKIELVDEDGTILIEAADWRALDRVALVDRIEKGRRPAGA